MDSSTEGFPVPITSEIAQAGSSIVVVRRQSLGPQTFVPPSRLQPPPDSLAARFEEDHAGLLERENELLAGLVGTGDQSVRCLDRSHRPLGNPRALGQVLLRPSTKGPGGLDLTRIDPLFSKPWFLVSIFAPIPGGQDSGPEEFPFCQRWQATGFPDRAARRLGAAQRRGSSPGAPLAKRLP